jgi:DNA repair exonuclease SbcCD ATPase subunit
MLWLCNRLAAAEMVSVQSKTNRQDTRMIDMRKREKAVYQACERLAADGVEPSVRRLRDMIGGSTDALAKYLRAWRELQPSYKDNESGTNAVQLATSNLYDQMLIEARAVLAADEEKRDKVLSEAAEQLSVSKSQLDIASETIRDQIDLAKALQAENDNLKASLSEASSQLAANRVQLDNSVVERGRIADEVTAVKSDNHTLREALDTLHMKLDETRDAAAGKQELMSNLLAETHQGFSELEKQLTREKEARSALSATAKQLAKDHQHQVMLNQHNKDEIDALQKEALNKSSEHALLLQANEHLEARTKELERTIEKLTVKLEKQSQLENATHTQQLEAIAAQLSQLTKSRRSK